ncbi:hypothetical protein ACHAQA_000105 [Verticillium albo-atrum]
MSAKRKASARFAPPAVKSAIKVPTKARIDESRTAVSSTDNIQSASLRQTQETIDISSDPDSDDEDASDDGAGSDDPMNGVETSAAAAPSIAPNGNGNGVPAETQATTTDAADPDSDAEATSPSFGELLRGTIDVPAILSQQAVSSAPTTLLSTTAASKALTTTSRAAALDPPSLSSLSTVLTQALRTEDTELLESCLQITDTPSIHATIERLDSALAGLLLTRLAARFHRRPGRAGSLMTWVKWTLVAHGGALAVQPKVLDRLVALQKVLNERARGLPSLLALKGKLDMLDAQMQLRQNRQRGGAADDAAAEEDDDDEEGAIYVEGEEGDVDAALAAANGALLALEAGDDEDDAPATNGFVADSDVDDDDSDVEEAESDDDGEEPLDEDEVDHLDVEDSMDEDEDSDAEAAPPTKLRKTARSFGKRR